MVSDVGVLADCAAPSTQDGCGPRRQRVPNGALVRSLPHVQAQTTLVLVLPSSIGRLKTYIGREDRNETINLGHAGGRGYVVSIVVRRSIRPGQIKKAYAGEKAGCGCRRRSRGRRAKN